MSNPNHPGEEKEGTVKVLDADMGKVKELRMLGTIPYGRGEYALLYDPDMKMWYLMKRGRLIRVYEGEAEFHVVEDPFFSDWRIMVAKTLNGVYLSTDITKLASEITRKDGGARGNYFYTELWVRAMVTLAEGTEGVVKTHVIGGFYPEGFVEGYVPYPAVNWECEPRCLEDFAKYIIDAYPPENRTVALANAAFAVAKVYSPAVRLAGYIMDDCVVLNAGEAGVGKTTLFHSIINMLGLDPARVMHVGDEPVKSYIRLRDILAESNAPLFLNDVGEGGFRTLLRFGLSAAFAFNAIDFEPLRRGLGAVRRYYNLRSIMVNANMKRSRVEKIIARLHHSDDREIGWALRRLIILSWEHVPIKPKAYSCRKPILGCLRELWGNGEFRQRVLKAYRITDLAKTVMEELHRVYGVDTTPYIKAVDAVSAEYDSYMEATIDRYRRLRIGAARSA